MFGLLLAGWVFIAPLITTIMAFSTRSELKRVRAELLDLEDEVRRLRDRAPAPGVKVAPVAARSAGLAKVAPKAVEPTPEIAPSPELAAEPEIAAEPVVSAEAPVSAETASELGEEAAGEAGVEAASEVEPGAEAASELEPGAEGDSSEDAPAPEEPPESSEPAPEPAKPEKIPLRTPPKPVSIEQLGTWIFAATGGLFVLLAGLLFFNYALDQGWFGRLGPGARFAMGVALGLGCLFVATRLKARDYHVPAGAFSGGGLGLLYGAIYAGHSLYELFPQPVAFGSMVGVTAVAGLLAWRWNSQFVSILGLIGGLLTPIVLSTGENKAVALFSYMALLAVGAAAVSVARRWPITLALSAFGTLAIHLGWAAEYADASQVLISFTASVVFAVIFGGAAAHPKAEGGVVWVGGAALLAQCMGALPAILPHDVTDWVGGDEIFTDPGVIGFVPLAWLLFFAVATHALAVRRGQILLSLGAVAAVGLDQLAVTGSWADELSDLVSATHPLYFMLAAGIVAPALLAWGVARALGPEEPEDKGFVLACALAVAGSCGALAAMLAEQPTTLLAGAVPVAIVIVGLLASPRAPWLALIGTLLACMPVYAGLDALNDAEQVHRLVPALLAIIALNTAAPLMRPELRDKLGPWLASAVAGPALYFPLHLAWEQSLGVASIGVLPILLGAVALISVAYLRRIVQADTSDRTLGIFIFVATLFACLAVPVQLSEHWLVLGWAAEAALLAWLGTRVPQVSLRWFALALVGLASLRLLPEPFMIEFPAADLNPLFNIVVLTWAGLGVGTLATANGLGRGEPLVPGLPVPTILRTWGTLVFFGLLNVVLALAFAEEGHPRFHGGTLTQEMLRSLSWALFGGGLLVLGVVRRNRGTRLLGMGFLMLAAVKVFFADLWTLEGMFRVGSVLGAALTLLASAVLLQKVVLSESDTAEPAEEDDG
ncbi:MAG: DUF2339 domain-containing protein [Alphaproteobacteria bacterium]|nr:DUF2339 domain-containing protein [Alphaproteobacteria bacterium]